jgi:hypothetical protein
MKRTAAIVILAFCATMGCSKSRQNDSPKLDSTGKGSSASEGYKDANKNTPAAPAKSYEQGTGTNTGDRKNNQPSTTTSTPGTDHPGKGPSNGQSNETVPPGSKK